MENFRDSEETLVQAIRRHARSFMDGSTRSERVLSAFDSVDRKSFLPENAKHLAAQDESIAVAANQTTSQPSLLAFMFDKLNIKSGDRILEIGTGVGYAAAVVSQLCGGNGSVVTVEIIPELASKAKNNLEGFQNVKAVVGDGSLGYPESAPYDVIFLSAGAGQGFNHDPLLAQLSENGRLMVPRKFGELYLFRRDKNTVAEEVFYSVNFVPLKGQNSG